MEFCGLSYLRCGEKPRPEGGATSDHFLDVAKLEMEPAYAEYVGEAFNPVGLMLDFWREKLPPGDKREVQVYVINDREEPWKGSVELGVVGAKAKHAVISAELAVPGLGRKILTFGQVSRQSGRLSAHRPASRRRQGDPQHSRFQDFRGEMSEGYSAGKATTVFGLSMPGPPRFRYQARRRPYRPLFLGVQLAGVGRKCPICAVAQWVS